MGSGRRLPGREEFPSSKTPQESLAVSLFRLLTFAERTSTKRKARRDAERPSSPRYSDDSEPPLATSPLSSSNRLTASMSGWGLPAESPAPAFGDTNFDLGAPRGGNNFGGHTGFGGDDGDNGGSDDRTCNHCGKEGHIRRDCPEAPPRDNNCRHCGQEGHMKRDCPDLPEDQRGPGACFNCGQVGHNKADCTEPRQFSGICRHCGQEGHPARECPDKPPELCRNCRKEGHSALECKDTRKLDNDDVPTVDCEEAWGMIEKASSDRDLDDLRDAVKIYVNAVPDTKYAELERAFREHRLNFFIIAYERKQSETYTLMDLQGNLGKKYTIGFFNSDKAPRSTMKEGWPASPEENMARLADSGVPVDTHIPKCHNCDQIGHTSKACKEEKVERADKVEVRCYNCDELGHRPRDCPKPRADRFACNNCGQRGHNSKECTEPRSAENIECKNCGVMGHFSRDCPDRKPMLCNNCGEEGHKRSDCTNPANPAMMKCRNCDEMGHSSRECTKPKDWSRVTCQNCGETGHGKARCKNPPKDEGGMDDGGFGDYGGFGAAENGGLDSAPAPPEPINDNHGGFNDW